MPQGVNVKGRRDIALCPGEWLYGRKCRRASISVPWPAHGYGLLSSTNLPDALAMASNHLVGLVAPLRESHLRRSVFEAALPGRGTARHSCRSSPSKSTSCVALLGCCPNRSLSQAPVVPARCTRNAAKRMLSYPIWYYWVCELRGRLNAAVLTLTVYPDMTFFHSAPCLHSEVCEQGDISRSKRVGT